MASLRMTGYCHACVTGLLGMAYHTHGCLEKDPPRTGGRDVFWLKEQPQQLLTACFWVWLVVLAGGFLTAAGVVSILCGALLMTAGLGSVSISQVSPHAT